jgi:hypothetical protein
MRSIAGRGFLLSASVEQRAVPTNKWSANRSIGLSAQEMGENFPSTIPGIARWFFPTV